MVSLFLKKKIIIAVLDCRILPSAFAGSAAITKLFEGEPDHLIPSISDGLLDNNMFAVAGRIVGHSFLHHGPSFPGLSPAIIHTLFGGSLETIPITVQDCPDLDVRDIVTMVRCTVT